MSTEHEVKIDLLGFLTEDHVEFWEALSILRKHYPDETEAAAVERARAWLGEMLGQGLVVVLDASGEEVANPVAAIGDADNWLFGRGGDGDRPKLYASRKGRALYFDEAGRRLAAGAKETSSAP